MLDLVRENDLVNDLKVLERLLLNLITVRMQLERRLASYLYSPTWGCGNTGASGPSVIHGGCY